VIIDPGNRKTLRCHGVKIIATSEMANFTWFCADGLWIAIAASVPFAINVEISFEIADLESANHIVALASAGKPFPKNGRCWMPVFTFEIVRHGEAPVIADVLRLPDERAIWCRAEALALRIENRDSAFTARSK